MKFGLELEFFVKNNSTKEFIPAYKVTNFVDGNPVIGELRTKVHNNITDCVFELKKLIYLEEQKLIRLEHEMVLIPAITVSKEFLRELREDSSYVNKKELSVLKQLSVYPNGKLGKILPRHMFKASLQLSLSQNNSFSYRTFHKRTIGKAYDYESKCEEKSYSSLFDYPSIIFRLDKIFQASIKLANRVKGVYAIEEGEYGQRIEYRSLPNTINLDTLIDTLTE